MYVYVCMYVCSYVYIYRNGLISIDIDRQQQKSVLLIVHNSRRDGLKIILEYF